MTRSKSITLLAGAAAVPLIALAVAGCGGGGSATPAASAQPKTTSGQSATVGAQSEGSLGTILVDSQGRTLYMFQKDSAAKSACYGACASEWPPLRASSSKPTAGSGLSASGIGTTSRSDGKPQVTYNAHPLYLFSGDQRPGDTAGQGLTDFGGKWYALSATGAQTTPQASSTSTGSSNSGGGYGY
jgi:predicted lipoprotein with Yx(FWY)xxD motif